MARRKTKKQHRVSTTPRRTTVSAKAARRKSPSTPTPAYPTKILVVPDTHVPYEHEGAFNLMLKAACTLNGGQGPDAVVLLGDFFDCYELSTHEKAPERRMSLADELEQTKYRLGELAAIVNPHANDSGFSWTSTDPDFREQQKKFRRLYDENRSSKSQENFRQLYYILGNHENRIERALGRDPQRGVLSTYMSAGLLHKQTLADIFPEWCMVNYMHTLFLRTGYMRTPAVALTHDVGKAGQTAHIDAGRVMGAMHTMIGHTHRLAQATHTVEGRTFTDHMFGWLGDDRQQSYRPAVRMARDWAHGFGVITVDARVEDRPTGETWGKARQWRVIVDPLVHVQGVAIRHEGPDADDELSCVLDGVVVRSGSRQ